MSAYEGSKMQERNEDAKRGPQDSTAQSIRRVDVTPKTETVNHPKHYNAHPSGIECIQIVEGFNFNIGNAVKYVWRAGLKPGAEHIEDLKKAIWYLDREIQRLEGTSKAGSVSK